MEICVRCGDQDHDRRTLFMSCFSDMNELKVPFILDSTSDRTFFTLRVCKSCRADWMHTIEQWFNGLDTGERDPNPMRCIPVRSMGATRWLTQEEYDKLMSLEE